MSQRMDWGKLLSKVRLGRDREDEEVVFRSAFEQDFDRIAFSSGFRRLQDKTQVFPLAESDYVRKRLTHSLEVSCVGRSLGTAVGHRVIETDGQLSGINVTKNDFGAVVSAACLAHDIGNPPFGHSGEEAVRHWFYEKLVNGKFGNLEALKANDYRNFDGNAQGFRTLTRLQYPTSSFGLRLTCATLATFTKYPVSSSNPETYGKGKFGFFQSEREHIERVALATGLIERGDGWCRHPLAYLVEAADDICYRIIDFEDGIRLRLIDHPTGRKALEEIVKNHGNDREKEYVRGLPEIGKYPLGEKEMGEEDQIEFLRSIVIGIIIRQVTDVFMSRQEEILSGQVLEKGLLKHISCADDLVLIKTLSQKEIYATRPVLEIEAAGFTVIPGLLDAFFHAMQSVSKAEKHADPEEVRKHPPYSKSEKVLQLLPPQLFDRSNPEFRRIPDVDLYTRLQKIIDHVAGMTDSYAVSTYRKLKGTSLPSGAT